MGERVELQIPGSDATLGVIRHGHYGRPVLVFPSEAGRAEDFANNGMLEAVADLVDAGRVSFFCVDSLDKFSWSAYDQPTEERARRHRIYHAWLEQAVVPHIAWEMGGWQRNIITFGVSLGAFHAANFTLQRSDIAPLSISLSGSYDPTGWRPWGEVGEATYFANPPAYVAGAHGDHQDAGSRQGDRPQGRLIESAEHRAARDLADCRPEARIVERVGSRSGRLCRPCRQGTRRRARSGLDQDGSTQ